MAAESGVWGAQGGEGGKEAGGDTREPAAPAAGRGASPDGVGLRAAMGSPVSAPGSETGEMLLRWGMEVWGGVLALSGGATLVQVPRESAERESHGVPRMPGVRGPSGVRHQQAISLISEGEDGARRGAGEMPALTC